MERLWQDGKSYEVPRRPCAGCINPMQTKRGLLIHGVFVFRHADASLQSSLLSYFQTWRDFTTAERSAKPLGNALSPKVNCIMVLTESLAWQQIGMHSPKAHRPFCLRTLRACLHGWHKEARRQRAERHAGGVIYWACQCLLCSVMQTCGRSLVGQCLAGWRTVADDQRSDRCAAQSVIVPNMCVSWI